MIIQGVPYLGPETSAVVVPLSGSKVYSIKVKFYIIFPKLVGQN